MISHINHIDSSLPTVSMLPTSSAIEMLVQALRQWRISQNLLTNIRRCFLCFCGMEVLRRSATVLALAVNR